MAVAGMLCSSAGRFSGSAEACFFTFSTCNVLRSSYFQTLKNTEIACGETGTLVLLAIFVPFISLSS